MFTAVSAPEMLVPVRAIATDDPMDILQFVADSFDYGAGAALITLVEIRGGAARALGSQMAVNGNGAYCGFVSGGCTEAAVAAEAMEAIKKETDRFLRLGEGSPFFDIVLPCGGGINLAIHVLKESSTLCNVIADLAHRRRTAIEYDPANQTLRRADAAPSTGWQSDRFRVTYQPLPRVLLCGRSIEVDATARVAQAVGYDTICHEVGFRERLDPEMIDPDTAVVLLCHDIEQELPILEAALSRTPFYIGALGSSRTHSRRSEALRAMGYSKTDIARIKAPIGIFSKARDSRSIALSVLADVAATYGNHP